MKTCPFKVGDKVMLRDSGTSLECVAAVRYRFVHEGKPGTQVFYLDLVGRENPSNRDGGWPATSFRLIWTGDKAAY
jgi:hypothetical protein